jgi:hypothetical protein
MCTIKYIFWINVVASTIPMYVLCFHYIAPWYEQNYFIFGRMKWGRILLLFQWTSGIKIQLSVLSSTQKTHDPDSEPTQSLLLLFNAACLAEKQQIPIL